MAKPTLPEPLHDLERDIIDAMLREGLRPFRADATYPESHSDMEACVRGLLGLGPGGTGLRCADLQEAVQDFRIAIERFRRALQGRA